jgi:hypothetical protein
MNRRRDVLSAHRGKAAEGEAGDDGSEPDQGWQLWIGVVMRDQCCPEKDNHTTEPKKHRGCAEEIRLNLVSRCD